MNIIRYYRNRRAVKELYRLAERYKLMRIISDDFGFGPILRYGKDRYE